MPYPGPQIKRVEIELDGGRKFEMLPDDIADVRIEHSPPIDGPVRVHLILDLVADWVHLTESVPGSEPDSLPGSSSVLPGEPPRLGAGGTDFSGGIEDER